MIDDFDFGFDLADLLDELGLEELDVDSSDFDASNPYLEVGAVSDATSSLIDFDVAEGADGADPFFELAGKPIGDVDAGTTHALQMTDPFAEEVATDTDLTEQDAVAIADTMTEVHQSTMNTMNQGW